MTMLTTLLLDRTKWDLVLDSYGNIALASPPYSLEQDVASAARLFLNELWYSPTEGVPYFEEILGQFPPMSLITGRIEKAALTVPGVVSAQCSITTFEAREISGEIKFIDELGAARGVTF